MGFLYALSTKTYSFRIIQFTKNGVITAFLKMKTDFSSLCITMHKLRHFGLYGHFILLKPKPLPGEIKSWAYRPNPSSFLPRKEAKGCKLKPRCAVSGLSGTESVIDGISFYDKQKTML